MEKYTAKEILDLKLLKKSNGQPYTSYVAVLRRLSNNGFKPMGVGGNLQGIYELTKEEIDKLV